MEVASELFDLESLEAAGADLVVFNPSLYPTSNAFDVYSENALGFVVRMRNVLAIESFFSANIAPSGHSEGPCTQVFRPKIA